MTKKLPLCSSRQIVSALKRLGFSDSGKGKGSHESFIKETPHGKLVTVVVMGKKEISRELLKSILDMADIETQDFLRVLR